MISERLNQAINQQIKNELESYYLYLSMAAYFHSANLDGMGRWMRIQAHEEMVHAMKFLDHLLDRGGKVQLPDLKQHKTEWDSPLEAWQDAYKHEQFITSKINELMDLAREEKDYQVQPLLTWFIEEQIEEEATSGKVAEEMAMVSDTKQGLFFMDRELGQRAFPANSPLDPTAYASA